MRILAKSCFTACLAVLLAAAALALGGVAGAGGGRERDGGHRPASRHRRRVEVLKAGGNAVDAAVAVGYALAVVYPDGRQSRRRRVHDHPARGRRDTFLDFRERAPLAATKNMYLDDSGDAGAGPLAPTASSRSACRASVAGLRDGAGEYGTKPRETLIAPAIRLAREGFVLEDRAIVASFRRRSWRRTRRRRRSSSRTASRCRSARRWCRATSPGRCGDLRRRRRRPSTRANRRPDRQGERGGRRHPREGRFRRLQGARARAGRMQLSRLRDRLLAAAVLGRA